MNFAVLADDLTGANDTALSFVQSGIRTSVQLGLSPTKVEADGIVIDADSRELTPAEARKRARNLAEKLMAQGISCFYKKMDSTLRGSWAAEIQGMCDVLSPELVILAPAFPAAGRTTREGAQLLLGRRLEETELAHAPKTPVKASCIPLLVKEQAGVGSAVLPLFILRGSPEKARGWLEEKIQAGTSWIVVDIEEEKDFTLLMDTVRGRKRILWAGSAGLAAYLPAFYGWQRKAAPLFSARRGGALLCAGSISETTQEQIRRIKALCSIPILKLAPEMLFEEQGKEQLLQEIGRILASGRDVLLSAAETDADVSYAVQVGKAHGLSGKEMSERLACKMGEILRDLPLDRVCGLVVTGGDTAVHITRAIGGTEIVICQEVEPGIPLGILKREGAGEIPMVTKAGAFGSPNAFCKAIDALHGAGSEALQEESV